MKFAEFERQKLDPGRNVFTFVCSDEFLIHESRTVWPRLFGDGWLIEKLHVKEFEAIEPARLSENARTPSLFSESRAYLVTRGEKLKKDWIEGLIALNDITNSSVKVILSLDDTKAAQAMPSAFGRVVIDQVQSADAARWIVDRYKVPAELARYIVENVGPELFPLYNEMEKLQAYVGSRPVEMRDVDVSILRSERFGPWELDDALYARNYPKAVRLIGAMIEAGDEPLIMLSKVTRVWRQLFVAKGLAGRAGASEVAMAAGAPGFKGADLVAASRRYDWKQLAQGFRSILAADRAFKTSSPNPEVYFDVMLWKLMEGKGA